jgi:hypothetical protein
MIVAISIQVMFITRWGSQLERLGIHCGAGFCRSARLRSMAHYTLGSTIIEGHCVSTDSPRRDHSRRKKATYAGGFPCSQLCSSTDCDPPRFRAFAKLVGQRDLNLGRRPMSATRRCQTRFVQSICNSPERGRAICFEVCDHRRQVVSTLRSGLLTYGGAHTMYIRSPTGSS